MTVDFNVANHKVLLLDLMNLVHRARGGWQGGETPIVFNFFRGLKPLLEKFKPTRCIFLLDGYPKFRFELLPEYKETRPRSDDTFRKQKDLILEILSQLPVELVGHPDYEADDLAGTLVQHWFRDSNVTVVTNDTDYLQLLQKHRNVQIWNWRNKEFMNVPDFDYVKWKALRGDGSDNIPAIPGMSDAKAKKLLLNDQDLVELQKNKTLYSFFERNLNLINFHILSDAEMRFLQISKGHTNNFDWVKSRFIQLDFKSMITDSYWRKFQACFNKLI